MAEATVEEVIGPDGEVTTMQEEVDRKTLASMEWLLRMHDDKKIGDNSFKFGLRVLDHATNGLVDKEITMAIWSELEVQMK